MGKRSQYKGIKQAARGSGKQKTRPRLKVTVNDYRSTNYTDSSRVVTLVDGTEYRERCAYARGVDNGRRELLTPEELGKRTASQNGHDALGESGPLPVKDKPEVSSRTENVPAWVRERREKKRAPEYDTGAKTLNVPRYGTRKEIPIEDVPWNYREEQRWVRVSPAYENYRLETVVVKDQPKRNREVWAGATVARERDTRRLTTDSRANKGSHKADIGKRMPVPNR